MPNHFDRFLPSLSLEVVTVWRFMVFITPTNKSTYNLLRGLRGLISTVIIGVIRAHEPPSGGRRSQCGWSFQSPTVTAASRIEQPKP